MNAGKELDAEPERLSNHNGLRKDISLLLRVDILNGQETAKIDVFASVVIWRVGREKV